MVADSGFRLELVQSVNETKIRSVCVQCGEGRIVSALDESLQHWHRTHRCTKAPEGTLPIVPSAPMSKRTA